jgi:proteic killer suppression protein
MIQSFGDKTTQNLFHGISNKKTRTYKNIMGIIERKLDFLNAAGTIADLKSPPANCLEKLKGELKEFYSIRINDQYRLIFKWDNRNAYEVRITDYH